MTVRLTQSTRGTSMLPAADGAWRRPGSSRPGGWGVLTVGVVLVLLLFGCSPEARAQAKEIPPAADAASPSDQPEAQDPAPEAKQPSSEAERPDSETPGSSAAISRQKMLVYSLTIFVLAIFVGFEVITKVPPTLHTPLMSGSNAISGITIVGAIIVTGQAGGFSASSLGFFAVIFATINVVGGFLVTHRMLSMFKKKR